MTVYGYARVSSKDQNLDTQIISLKKFGVDQIVQEKITGIAVIKQLNLLIESMEDGDTLVVTRMDRLGRDTIQLLKLVEDLEVRNIHLVILDLNIDTRTYTGKFFLTVMAGFSEMERTIIKEKQRAGIEVAKKKGKYVGRVKKYTGKHSGMNHAIELYKKGNKTVKEICEITKVSRSALYREIKDER